jgi:hypothetical protein
MTRSRLNADSCDMHHHSLMGCDWANLAQCASDRADLAQADGHYELANRETATADSHYYSRYIRWPLR